MDFALVLFWACLLECSTCAVYTSDQFCQMLVNKNQCDSTHVYGTRSDGFQLSMLENQHPMLRRLSEHSSSAVENAVLMFSAWHYWGLCLWVSGSASACGWDLTHPIEHMLVVIANACTHRQRLLSCKVIKVTLQLGMEHALLAV